MVACSATDAATGVVTVVADPKSKREPVASADVAYVYREVYKPIVDAARTAGTAPPMVDRAMSFPGSFFSFFFSP